MTAVNFLSSISRYVINFSRSAYNLLGIKEVSSTIESEGRSCLIPTDLKFPALAVLHEKPLVHLVVAAHSTLDIRIRREMIFSLYSCHNNNCPLGPHSIGIAARTLIKDKIIESLLHFEKNEITIASYGSGGLGQDFSQLSRLTSSSQIRKIIYVLIDPIYRDQPGLENIGSFVSLLEGISDKTGIEFEVVAFSSVEEYSMGGQNRPDLIMDIDTKLLEDDVSSTNCDFQRLIRLLNDQGELISLNTGGQAFLSSYQRNGDPYHFHPLPLQFKSLGVPRLFHVEKTDASLKIIDVQEYNPQSYRMEKI